MEGERRVNEWNDLNLGEEIEVEESRTRGSGMASMIGFPSTNACLGYMSFGQPVYSSKRGRTYPGPD